MELIEKILLYLVSSGILAIIVNEFIIKIKQKKKMEEKQNKAIKKIDKKVKDLSESFCLYIENNGTDEKIKKIIKKKLKGDK